MSVPPPGIRRVSLVVDVEGFSRHRPPEQIDVQRRLVLVMRHACAIARIDLTRSGRQDTGDGQLIVLPPGIDESRVLPGFINGLIDMLYDVNARPVPSGRIRLRAALSQGLVHVTEAGFAGDSVISACRLLDSPILRQELREHRDSDLALIVTSDLYTDVMAAGYPGLPPDGFHEVTVEIPEKHFRTLAWILVPGQPPHAAGRRSRINDPLPLEIDFKVVFAFTAGLTIGLGTGTAIGHHIYHASHTTDHGTSHHAHARGHSSHVHGTHAPGHGGDGGHHA